MGKITFEELFVGGDQAHGRYQVETESCATPHTAATPADYAAHLAGGTGLGLVPIRPDGTCRFAAIDVDIDTIDHQELYAEVRRRRLPLAVCRSKSGGAHLYLFMREPGLAAAEVIALLKRWAACLGLAADTEIFPKQKKIRRGTYGNWINLPYHAGANGTSTRYAVGERGALSLKEFLAAVEFYDPATCDADVAGVAKLAKGAAPVVEKLTERAPRPTNGSGEFPPGYAAAALKTELARLLTTLAGTGNDQLNKASHAVGQLVGAGQFSKEQVRGQLRAAAVERKVNLYRACTAAEEREIDATIESGLTAGMADPRAAPLESLQFNDVDNAARFVAQHGLDLRFCHGPDRWYGWDGRRWREDQRGRVNRLARRTAKTIFRDAHEAFSSTNEQVRKGWKKVQAWAVRSGFEARLRAMTSLARSWKGIAIIPAELDAEPWLLTVNNGTLDLRTGELREPQREDLISKLAPVAYDAEARCPRFDKFLDRIMRGNPELLGYLQRLIGYFLTGLTQERQFTIAYGRGDNGKTTLTAVLLELLGDYGQTAEISTFLATRSDKVRDDLADLAGARIVIGMEVPENKQLAESLLKQLTGGEDRIKTRHLFKRYFTQRVTYKILMTANHKPVISGTDNAIWNRVHLLPFEVVIPAEEQDPKLLAKLRRELPGILAWAVRGCREWQRRGLDPPAEVLAATKEYRVEMDKIGAFLEDRCVQRTAARVGVSELYADYVEWCGGEYYLGRSNFGQRLKERDFRQERISHGTRRWVGLGLLARVGEAEARSPQQRRLPGAGHEL